MYYIQNFACVSVTSVCAARSFENWHRILGHYNIKDDLRKLEKIVNGMNISNTNDFNTETCALEKQSQVFSRKPDGRAKSPFEIYTYGFVALLVLYPRKVSIMLFHSLTICLDLYLPIF